MRKKLILVVDDDPAVVDILRDFLEAEGFSINTATNGLEALHTLDARYPDLVLCDLMLPYMTGHDLAIAMQADDTYRHIPFVLITAVDQRKVTRLSHYMEIVPKPFDMDALLHVITGLIGHPNRVQSQLDTTATYER